MGLNVQEICLFCILQDRRYITGVISNISQLMIQFILSVPQSTSKVLAQETAHDDTESMLEICGPFADRVFCSVGGFSSICTYDYVSYIDIDLPGTQEFFIIKLFHFNSLRIKRQLLLMNNCYKIVCD